MTELEVEQLKYPCTVWWPTYRLIVFLTEGSGERNNLYGKGYVIDKGNLNYTPFQFENWYIGQAEHYLPRNGRA